MYRWAPGWSRAPLCPFPGRSVAQPGQNEHVHEDKLERLADAFETHGIAVRSNLRPGVPDEAIDELALERGVVLPEDFRALYRWRNGHVDYQPSSDHLIFRDAIFLSLDELDRAQIYLDAYARLQKDPYIPPLDIDISRCVPFAEFNGSVYVVACGEQSLTRHATRPVVEFSEDVWAAFLSIETMIDTCIAWVKQPGYERYHSAPNEREIWERHNPGIFDL